VGLKTIAKIPLRIPTSLRFISGVFMNFGDEFEHFSY